MNTGLLNYTPHEIVLMDPTTKEPIYRIAPQGESIRLLQESKKQESFLIENTYIRTVSPSIFYGISLMPPQGSSIIVSAVVAEYLTQEHRPHCKDIFAPDTSPAGCVRDASGRIIGTTQLVRYQ